MTRIYALELTQTRRDDRGSKTTYRITGTDLHALTVAVTEWAEWMEQCEAPEGL